MTKLTIIIPFLNEGKEVENTVVSIKETAVSDPAILLINDGSDDGFDYESVAGRYNCRYIKNEKRQGSAPSRDIGVAACETPYFLFLDGHMRLYEKGWDERLVKLLTENPRSLLCGQTKAMIIDDARNVVTKEDKRKPYGGYIDMEPGGALKLQWNYFDTAPNDELAEISCVFGAAYACSKTYWEHLLGMKGLLCYGLEEQLISIKVWLEGGKCLLVKNFITGHLYRKAFPYEAPNMEMMYNRLFILELFFPYSIKNDFFAEFKSVNSKGFKEAYELLKINFNELKSLKDSLNAIFHNKIDYFLEMNEKIKAFN
jgi:glycosyltransferase involved in cell wall biosynthesis